MRTFPSLVAALGMALVFAAPVFAADPAPMPPNEMQDMMHGAQSEHGKRCGMHGMKCKHKMHGMPLMIPQLPPGNEKLQLQMQAEIMQKVGEITAKYAAQLK